MRCSAATSNASFWAALPARSHPGHPQPPRNGSMIPSGRARPRPRRGPLGIPVQAHRAGLQAGSPALPASRAPISHRALSLIATRDTVQFPIRLLPRHRQPCGGDRRGAAGLPRPQRGAAPRRGWEESLRGVLTGFAFRSLHHRGARHAEVGTPIPRAQPGMRRRASR